MAWWCSLLPLSVLSGATALLLTTEPEPLDEASFAPDYLQLYAAGTDKLGLDASDPTLLAALYGRTGDERYAQAAAANLAGVVNGGASAAWLATSSVNLTVRRFWVDGFDRTSSEFGQAPGAYFESCTGFGLPAYLLLNRSGYDKGWDARTEEDFRKFHETACFVWYSGAWNQGTWSGIGNTMFAQLWPAQAREKTPWMYPFLSRAQHAERVWGDFFEQQVMMEDADGYNQIWTPMALAWPELWREGRQQALATPGMRQMLSNFRDYVAPDGRMFQFASGLSSHYASSYWVAVFERAATIFNDGTFRHAAMRMWAAMHLVNVSTTDQSEPNCVRANPPCCAGCFGPKGVGIPMTEPVALATGTPWMASYNLLCSRYVADDWGTRACGVGGANTSLPPRAPADYEQPSATVHRRREVGELQMADKVVLSHSKRWRSQESFLTAEAHTGRSLWHSHATQVGSIDNFWRGGARLLGASGKHDGTAVGNHVMMVANRNASVPHAPGFPFRNASDMFEAASGSGGKANYLFLPTHSHLPMLDAAGALYLKRNFSVLGFSCDNWMNETVTMHVLPVSLRGPNGARLAIDDFAPPTSALWRTEHSRTVADAASPSGYSLQITCPANATASCGPPDAATGSCALGCVLDESDWCQISRPTFVSRRRSASHPLPTEAAGVGAALDVREYEAFDLRWRLSANYRPEPRGAALYPLGMQTVDFAPQSNRTLSYYGNDVKQLGGCSGSADACFYEGHPTHPHREIVGGGEFWPIVSQEATAANHKGKDLFALIEVERGYFTSGTAVSRQILALEEGPLVVVDSVTADTHADGWRGGPSWSLAIGNDVSELIHGGKWPANRTRVQVSAVGRNAFAAKGFVDVYDLSGTTLSPTELLLVFPSLEQADIVARADGAPSRTEQGTGGPLYWPVACSRSRLLAAGRTEHFVSVLLPFNTSSLPAGGVEELAQRVNSTVGGEAVEVVVGDVTATLSICEGCSKAAGWRVHRKPASSQKPPR